MRGSAAKAYLRAMVSAGVFAAGMVWSGGLWAQQGVINLEESVIRGRIQKPEAFYILQPATLDYEGLDTQPSFLEELMKTVEQEPF